MLDLVQPIGASRRGRVSGSKIFSASMPACSRPDRGSASSACRVSVNHAAAFASGRAGAVTWRRSAGWQPASRWQSCGDLRPAIGPKTLLRPLWRGRLAGSPNVRLPIPIPAFRGRVRLTQCQEQTILGIRRRWGWDCDYYLLTIIFCYRACFPIGPTPPMAAHRQRHAGYRLLETLQAGESRS